MDGRGLEREEFFCRAGFKLRISRSLALFPYCACTILHYKAVYTPLINKTNTNNNI